MAHPFYITVKAAKAGAFKGEASDPKHKDKILGLAFDYTIQMPTDLATGQASGKRRHQPIKFIKEIGASSPQFYNALVTHDTLTEVLFEFMRTSLKEGTESIYYTIKLTNAFVSKIRMYRELEDQTEASEHARANQELEEIEVGFSQIEIKNAISKTTAADDWAANRA